MGCDQEIDQLLEKLVQVLNRKNKSNLILMERESNEMLAISVEELEKLRKLRRPEKNLESARMTAVLGTSCQPFTSTDVSQWILDLGASAHVTGRLSEFASYAPHPPTHNETIQTADGTYQPIKGVGTVKYTPSITLSSVLHVPSFLVSLVSMSSLIDDIDCRIMLINTIV